MNLRSKLSIYIPLCVWRLCHGIKVVAVCAALVKLIYIEPVNFFDWNMYFAKILLSNSRVLHNVFKFNLFNLTGIWNCRLNQKISLDKGILQQITKNLMKKKKRFLSFYLWITMCLQSICFPIFSLKCVIYQYMCILSVIKIAIASKFGFNYSFSYQRPMILYMWV